MDKEIENIRLLRKIIEFFKAKENENIYNAEIILRCQFIVNNLLVQKRITNQLLFLELAHLFSNLQNVTSKNKDCIEAMELTFNMRNILNNIVDSFQQDKTQYIDNSPEFYDSKIKSLQEESDSLSRQIAKLKSNSSKEKREWIIKLKEEQAQKNELLEKLQEEKEKNEKRTNAIKNWEAKITSAFNHLRICISPLKNERKRLIWLYWIYFSASFSSAIALLFVLYFIYGKICEIPLEKWISYLSMAFPVPVIFGLLFGAITQMNRAQRQIVTITKEIHNLDYVELLLLAMNTLSSDVSQSMSRVNDAIDKIVEKHINYKSDALKEENLLKEEKKDSIPYDKLIGILKELKEIKE